MVRSLSLVFASAVGATTFVQHANTHSYMLSPVVEWLKEFYDLSAHPRAWTAPSSRAWKGFRSTWA